MLLPAITKRAVGAATVAASGGREREEEVGPKKTARLCQHPDCVKRASYGYEGRNGPTVCTAKHTPWRAWRTSSKWCEHPGCKHQARFSQPGQPAMSCKANALGGMEDVHSKR